MKIFKNCLCVPLILIFLIFNKSVVSQEKVMLSTDRDIYISGESIWFNVGAYQLDSNESSRLSKVVYVELLNKNNVPVVQLKYRVEESCSQSKFLITDSLTTGNYSLRAYTRWMQNKDESLYAKKVISIINPFAINSLPKGDQYFSNDTIFTFPEGGILFPGVENKVLIRTYNSLGKYKAIEGKIVDKDNKIVTLFKTNTEGCGLFKFIPKKNGEYFYCSDDIRVSLPTISNEKVYLQLSEFNSGIYSFNIYGKFNNNVWLDIVSKDGAYNRRYAVPNDGRIVINDKDLMNKVFFALLVNDKKDILAYRAFSGNKRQEFPSIKINTDKQFYSKRKKVNLKIDQIKKLKNISVSVVKSCLLNPKDNQSKFNYLSENDALISMKPSVFIGNDRSRVFLPEVEGELITGRITCVETGKPITGEKLMLNFVSRVPIMKFSTTDSLGRFRFVVNRYGQEEMVIQPFSNDSTLLNYKITLDDNFSSHYSEDPADKLIMDSISAKKINEAIVNMQINTIYSSFKKKIGIRDSIERLDAFYGKPNVSAVINKYIGLPTVEEVIREVVPFTGIRKNNGEYYFRVYEEKSLYPRGCETLTMMDGVPIKNVKNVFEIAPQEIEKIEVVNLNFYLQEEELGYLLSFFSKDMNMADMEFDQSIFRQIHKGFIGNYQYRNPNYSNTEIKVSRLADFRNVLYYHVFSNIENADSIDVDFYTSDDESDYTIVVKGINSLGEYVENRKNISVSE